MASAWIARVPLSKGRMSYRVLYRLGGRESAPRHGGSFRTSAKRESAETGSLASSPRCGCRIFA